MGRGKNRAKKNRKLAALQREESGLAPGVERAEELDFIIKMNSEQYDDSMLKDLMSLETTMSDGDKITIEYKLFVHYYGRVASILGEITRLRDEGVPVNVDITGLRHSRCLLADILIHVDTLIG